MRPANGQGSAELLYKNPGAFMNLTDWSSDGRFLTFAISDMKGGALYTLPLEGGADRKPIEILKTDLRLFGPRFSPDGRFLSYIQIDKANRAEVFVRPVDPKAAGGPWQISEGTFSPAFWRRDGKELYYLARDQVGDGRRREHLADVLLHETQSAVPPASRGPGPYRVCQRRWRPLPRTSSAARAAAAADHRLQSTRRSGAEGGRAGLVFRTILFARWHTPARVEERSQDRTIGPLDDRTRHRKRVPDSPTIHSRGSVRCGRQTANTSISLLSVTATFRSTGDSRTEPATRNWCSATQPARSSASATFLPMASS